MMKSWIVGKKEFFANLLSIRFLIIVLVFSILVVGVTYGETLTTQEERERETTHILLSHYIDLEDDGIYEDLVLYYSDIWGNPLEGKEIELYDMQNISSEENVEGERPTPNLIKWEGLMSTERSFSKT